MSEGPVTASWFDDAFCKGSNVEVFFPERGDEHSAIRAAKAACAQCSVTDECREYAVENNIVYGIFGGLSPKERRPYRAAYTSSLELRTHGTRHYYLKGCRCDECRAANTEHHRRLRFA